MLFRSVSTDRSFYLPGQRVEGVVQSDYFFGKPVALGEVQVVGSVWDVERTVMVDLRGQTDENGTYEFSFDLPDYFAGAGLESGQAQFALEVTVVDQTEHPEPRLSGGLDQGRHPGRIASALAGFVGWRHLDHDLDSRGPTCDLDDEGGPVDGLNDADVPGDDLDLVGLELPDEMDRTASLGGLGYRGGLRVELLGVVLADRVGSGGHRGGYRLRRERLGDCDHRDSVATSRGDSLPDLGEAVGYRGGVHRRGTGGHDVSEGTRGRRTRRRPRRRHPTRRDRRDAMRGAR